VPLHQDERQRGKQPEADVDHHRQDASRVVPTYNTTNSIISVFIGELARSSSFGTTLVNTYQKHQQISSILPLPICSQGFLVVDWLKW
jgi:hypothetical protein